MDGKLDERKPQNRMVLDAEREKEYAGSLSGIFDELVECNIATGQCRSIFFTKDKSCLCVNRTLEDFQAFAWERIHPEECGMFLGIFNKKRMEEAAGKGEHLYLEFRCLRKTGGYTWTRVLLIPEKHCRDIMLCYGIDLGQEDREVHVLKQIVDRYVYRNCDYLICLDASKDAYTLLRRNEGASLFPPDSSGSYSRMIGFFIDTYVVKEDRERVRKEMQMDHVLSVLDKEGEHTVSYGVTDSGKGYFRKRFQYVYYDRANHIVLLMRTDITKEYKEQCRQKERLRDALQHARVDSLTGLFNRQAIHREIGRFLNDPRHPRAVLLFMDLDNFKNVNDTMGHRSGDQVLCQVAELFRNTLRSSDLIGRVGGDEFVAFLTGVVSEEEGMECARRLCDAVGGITDPMLGPMKLSCSIGGAVCPRDGQDYDTLFVKADAAVYEAKHRGKNQCVFYMPGMDHSTSSMS
ncbi:sensor domain-containing diguanylate cyclase [Enterocloster citroniae]|jgi:diguanylate cyclase (GGDEF)-like protein|uniref:Diguanylate cyclase (GGDEF)-like protein n=2 Tax=Enterocloster citroniae TaxID=358743 RepID=A0ABV2FRI9_9FIRM|nr:sensor domain-containing diguanylate cyclase [Enterocloster citroniae]KMW16685.1 hypothetical protein HMPREF9470_04185 [[Clostridium] citroniae WAL-19142]